MKGFSKKGLVLIAVLTLVSSFCVSVVFALTVWNHDITGEVTGNNLGFQVYRDAACTTVWDGSVASTVADLTQPYTETYYIKNLSNAVITVTGSVDAGSTTCVWVDGVNSLTLAAGQVGSLSVTLSNFNGGLAGSFTVSVTFQ